LLFGINAIVNGLPPPEEATARVSPDLAEGAEGLQPADKASRATRAQAETGRPRASWRRTSRVMACTG